MFVPNNLFQRQGLNQYVVYQISLNLLLSMQNRLKLADGNAPTLINHSNSKTNLQKITDTIFEFHLPKSMASPLLACFRMHTMGAQKVCAVLLLFFATTPPHVEYVCVRRRIWRCMSRRQIRCLDATATAIVSRSLCVFASMLCVRANF